MNQCRFSRVSDSARRSRFLLPAICIAPLFAGCGGGEAGGEVKLAEARRYDLDASMAESGSIRVPGSSELNYASFRSGQTGTGRGESRRVGAAGAVCKAECEPDGSGWGEFQIGYSFDNKTNRTLDATVKLRLKVSEANEIKRDAPNAAEDSTTANTTLRFFIKDTVGRELKSGNILNSSLALGPKSSGKEQELVFDARFEPERGYYLIVTGRAEVSSEEGEAVAASVEVTDMALDIAWKPAPPEASAAKPAAGAVEP